jgi:outer membrane protein assembly factor BamD (BamD/ComL family)
MRLSHTADRTWTSLACLAALCAGCSLVGRPQPDASYEAAQREINGPAQNYRGDVRQASYEQEQRNQERFADDDAGFQLEDLKPSAVANKVKAISGKGRNPDAAQELFRRGDRLYEQAVRTEGEERRRLLLEAAPFFEQAAARWPGSTLEHDALFRLGECYFFADRYVQANEAFEKLLAQYKNSRYLDAIDARRFALAQYWLEWERAKPESFYAVNVLDDKRPWRDTKGNALRLFDRIRLDDPTGKLADDATMAAANAHFLAGDFYQADMFYSDLRRTYPSSEHQFNAHFLGVQAKLLTYQGEDYSVTPLVEAGKLVEQIRRQFPQEYAENREEVDKASGQVRKLLAERHWRMAEYFERRWEYGSARYYYDAIVKEFPGTPIAEEARQRLAALSDKPVEPPQPLKPLADLFQAGKDKLNIPTKAEKAQEGALR